MCYFKGSQCFSLLSQVAQEPAAEAVPPQGDGFGVEDGDGGTMHLSWGVMQGSARLWYPAEQHGVGMILVRVSLTSHTQQQRRALFSLHSNGYINIISPASCPVTDILMIQCRAQHMGTSTGRGLTWSRQNPPQGGLGGYVGGQSPWPDPKDSGCFNAGSQEPLPEMNPYIPGYSVCHSMGSMSEPGTRSQTLPPRKPSLWLSP